jgi:hypothetical protein
MTKAKKKQICDHLRDVLRHRLLAWDASNAAEELLGRDVDSASEEVDDALALIDRPEDVDKLADDDVLKIFQ